MWSSNMPKVPECKMKNYNFLKKFYPTLLGTQVPSQHADKRTPSPSSSVFSKSACGHPKYLKCLNPRWNKQCQMKNVKLWFPKRNSTLPYLVLKYLPSQHTAKRTPFPSSSICSSSILHHSKLKLLMLFSQCGNWGVSDKETAHLLQYFSTFRNEHFLW